MCLNVFCFLFFCCRLLWIRSRFVYLFKHFVQNSFKNGFFNFSAMSFLKKGQTKSQPPLGLLLVLQATDGQDELVSTQKRCFLLGFIH